MSHATADLEYFKCDLCGVYLHKDIFCDHRRDCKGLHSTELKKSECKVLEEQVGLETRRLIAARDGVALGGRTVPLGNCEAASFAGARQSPPQDSGEAEEAGAAAASPATTYASGILLSTAQLEKRSKDQVRRRVADEYHVQKEQALSQKLNDDERMKELLDYLDS